MRVRSTDAVGGVSVELVDESGAPVAVVSAFLRIWRRGAVRRTRSRRTRMTCVTCGAFSLPAALTWQEFGPPHALELLEALRATPSRRPAQRLGLTVATQADGQPARRLAPATVNRVLAAVSSFYEYAILAGVWDRAESDREAPRSGAGCGSPSGIGRSWAVRAASVRFAGRCGSRRSQRVPRPLTDGQVQRCLAQLRGVRDRAIVLLMLQGGLRPGEVLGLQLEDIAYGRRRVVVRHREDHPKGRAPEVPPRAGRGPARARGAGGGERVRDDVSARPTPTARWCSWSAAVARGVWRRSAMTGWCGCSRAPATRAGIREPWVTPHALSPYPRHPDVGGRDAGAEPAKAAGARLSGVDPHLHAGVSTRRSPPTTAGRWTRSPGRAS